jgi:lysyl oxidase
MHQARGHLPGDRWLTTVTVVALALAALLVAPGATPQALAVPSPDLLPDLVAEAPLNEQPAEPRVLADGYSHLLIRFNGRIHNIGQGPLEIRGSNPVNGNMTVTGQRIYRLDSSFYDDHSAHPQIHFEDTDGHDHWHLMGAARFSLWNEAGTAQLVPASKVGFCLEDGDPVDSFASPTPTYSETQIQRCREGQPNASSVFEGISPGWEDVYGANLPFQWIDVTDVAPGLYRLGAEMDPNDFVRESSNSNNGPTLATSKVAVPGYLASSLATKVNRARTITLPVQRYGTPGPWQYRIESPPKHGKLSVAPGASFTGPGVLYKPNRNFPGTDSFTFSARDSSSQFPVRSPVATVTLSPGSRMRVLTGLRFARRGRILDVRGRAMRSGRLRIQIKKAGRRLGSCRTRARSQRRFKCTVRLLRPASPAGARAIASVRIPRWPKVVNSFRVPRHLRSR